MKIKTHKHMRRPSGQSLIVTRDYTPSDVDPLILNYTKTPCGADGTKSTKIHF